MYKSMEDDPEGAFLQTPHGVLHVEDIRAYIHYKFEIIGIAEIIKDMSDMMEEEKLKPKFTRLKDLNIFQMFEFYEFDEPKWIKIILSRMHDKFIWMGDQPTMITKDLIHVVTGLRNEGSIPTSTKNTMAMVKDLTGFKWNKRAMTIDDIRQIDVRLIAKILGYKMHYSSRLNSISTEIILMTYKMVCEGERYNLCEVLRLQLLENLKQIKRDKENPFRFSSLIVHIFFHLAHKFLGMHPAAWNSDPTAKQISKSYRAQDKKWIDGAIYG